MTDQKNPPRTRDRHRDEQVADHFSSDTQEAMICIDDFEDALREAEDRGDATGYARGCAEALAELRAGAEPVAWCLIAADGGVLGLHEEKRIPESYPHRYATDALTPLYAHPPVPREAELEAALREAEAAFDRIGGAMAACKSRPRAGVCGQTVDAMIRASDFTIPGALVRELGEMAEKIRAALAAAPETRG